MEGTQVRRLEAPEIAQAATLLGRGMRDNPLHLPALGNDPAFRERALGVIFAAFLGAELTKGQVLGAFRDGHLVGVCGLMRPGRCQMTPKEKLRLLPTLLGTLGPVRTGRMLAWFGAWSAQDLKAPHWHLGPVGVAPELRRQRIGTALLEAFCAEVDAEAGVAYLETDKPENVAFYQRFGFTVVAEAPVLGVPNWFMKRGRNG